MNEQLLKLEQACLDASSTPVIITGLTLMILGLFLWIGGLKYLKAVTGFIGACIGAGVGFAISTYIDIHLAATICVSATVFAFIAMLVQQIIILILAIAIFSLAFGTGYLDYTIGKHGLSAPAADSHQLSNSEYNSFSGDNDSFYDSGDPFENNNTYSDKIRQLDRASQTAIKAGKYADTFGQKLRNIYAELKPTMSNNAGFLILWCVIGGIIGLVLAKLLKLVVMAFCCSIVGSSSMISGLMLSIIAKGTPVWSNLQNHHKVLTIVFGVMVAFGWVFQLITGGMKKSTKNRELEK